MKKTYVVGVAVLLAALLAMSGVAQSEMWVGGQLGGNFPLPSTVTGTVSAPGIGAFEADFDNLNWSGTVIGGAQIGYNFTNVGPAWMRFFGFAIDFTYNRLHAPSQDVTLSNITIPGLPTPTEIPDVPTTEFLQGTTGRLDGYESCLSFLFNFHYGFYPDSEVPTGRIVPYLAIGPGIIFSGIESGISSIGNAHATTVALVVEPGIRFMALKNVSIDTALRYRWASPSWEFDADPVFGVPSVVDLEAKGLNQLAFLIRANLHF